MAKLKGTPSKLLKHSHPREFSIVLTLIFMASQTLIFNFKVEKTNFNFHVLTIQVLLLVTIVSMINNNFYGTR